MVKNNLIRLVLYVIILMALLHVLAVSFYLYWFYWWFDMLMHFLGGLIVGLFSLWVFCAEKSKKVSSLEVLSVALIGGLVMGVAWEYFEYINGITINAIGDYRLDMVKDLVMDTTGAYFAHLYFILASEERVGNSDCTQRPSEDKL